MADTDEKLKAILDTVQNQLTAGAPIAVGFAAGRYKDFITPEHPLSSFIAGLIIVLIGFALLVWALFVGLRAINKAFSMSKWQFYVICGALVYVWGFMATALFFVAAQNAG